jgi:two-component system copper resistance phosphate regulon response regulator CusR
MFAALSSVARKKDRHAMRLLVIEDEARIRAFLARGFEAEGYTVDGADNGRDGLALALAQPYDLVLLDLLLPRLDGLQVLRELQRRRPELPVLILSARSDLPTKLRGFELGACDYLPKPFSLDELLARVRAHLRRSPVADGGNVLRAGRLELDLARRQARIDGTAADLADREFRLLHHLVVHCGEVVSRERLLSEVWGYHFDPGSNVVDVCVRRLRKKLGPNAPIETVRHAGYRLAA